MAEHPLQLPKFIPPRTSSHFRTRSHSTLFLNGSPSATPRPTSVPQPPSEGDWLSQSDRKSSSYLLPMTPPPPPDPSNGIGEDLIYQKEVKWSQDRENILLGPYDYLFGHPGKDIRSQLIAAFNVWLRVPPESLQAITKVVGMLHTASLLVDDVEDSSRLRRGIPVANSIFGTAQVINSANYVYFLALQELSKLQNPEMIEIYTEELLNLHRGQGMDLYWRDSLICPTEAEYLEMVGNKTGGLFRLAIKLMQAASHAHLNCVPLVNAIGLLFQIRDDHLNLSTAYTHAKGFCEDLTEGKFSFPVIHAIRSDPSNLVLMNILKQKTEDVEVKRYAVSYMEKKGSFEHSKKSITDLKARTLTLVEELEERASHNGRQGGEAVRRILERMTVP